MTYLMKVNDEIKKYAVIIEDDDRVAYAYLLENDQIIADVWLYNSTMTPGKPDWTNPENMPFLNSQDYVYEDRNISIEKDEDMALHWYYKADVLDKVEILEKKDNLIIAILCPNVKPGWSYMTKKRGPLAKPLSDFPY